MTMYLARLCWNEHGWIRPSGAARKAEGPIRGSGKTFASDHGYGHEEWLFRPEHTIGGWRYGFLQPAVKTSDASPTRDVILYTIDPDRGRWYLGRIDGVEILNETSAQGALREFERRGWLKTMVEDLSALGLSPASVWPASAARDYLNIRYRLDQVHMLPEAVAAIGPDPTIGQGKSHYWFYRLTELPKCLVGTHADPDQDSNNGQHVTAPVVRPVRSVTGA